MGDTLAKNGCAMPESFFGPHEFDLKMLQVTSTKVFEFASFEHIPHPFLRIQFRSITWQAFEMNPLGSTLAQKILDSLAAMNAGSIPHDQQVARSSHASAPHDAASSGSGQLPDRGLLRG
jgi:hypothetical protein